MIDARVVALHKEDRVVKLSIDGEEVSLPLPVDPDTGGVDIRRLRVEVWKVANRDQYQPRPDNPLDARVVRRVPR